MNTSEQINEIAAALAKAQASMAKAAKDSTNPHFRSKYADLASVTDACREALTTNGIAVVQAPGSTDDGAVTMTTRLVHSSGQWFETMMACRPGKPDAQGMGSVVSYLRRYCLAAMTGVVADDDDGEAASGRGEMHATAPQSPPQRRQPPKAPARQSQPANGSAPAGEAPTAGKPPVDWEQGDPIDIPGADGLPEVAYVASNGKRVPMAPEKAFAKVELAHQSDMSDADFDKFLAPNRDWLAAYYEVALKVFETAPRPNAK